MANTVNESLFLKSAHLLGYKSIVDVDVKFDRGLNIIIGKNAAGKTNFLRFLHRNLSLEYNELNNFSSTLIFQNGKEISIETTKNIEITELLEKPKLNSKIKSILKIEDEIVQDEIEKEITIAEKLIEKQIKFSSTFLCHGIPKDYLIIDKPISFRVEKKQLSDELFNILTENENPYFLRMIAIDVALTMLLDEFDDSSIRNKLNDVFKKIERIKNVLNAYSPISDIKVSENFNIFYDENKDGFTLSNFFLEFKIDDNWLPYSSLSDGTKRLFYIISEVYSIEMRNTHPSSNGRYYTNEEVSRIILIEEPELGIHPHQFMKLMEFLKEESEKKQIIITTHSPQALDVLSEEEFNKIIIAYSAGSKNGTKLRHLSPEELDKAKAYIKDSFLSDYWLYSDLEK